MRSTFATAALTCLFLFASCVSTEEHNRVLGANGSLQAEMASLKQTWRALSQENDRMRGELTRLGAQAADADWIREQKAKLDELLKQYQQGSPSSVPGVELVRTGEGLAFRVMGGVLFSPGRIEISEQGRQTLKQLIGTLQSQEKRIRVDGHTDDTPIVNSPWKTNLRLSAERAISVADFLVANGLPADKVGIAGFGEHRPSVAAATDEARLQNRRVEILMLDQ